jgi:hypothetical protein
MKTLLLLFLASAVSLMAQTNKIVTISDWAGRKEIIANAMNAVFHQEQDQVDDHFTEDQQDYDELEYRGDAVFSCEIVAFIYPPKKTPKTFNLHLVSHSKDWRFLDSHDCMVRYDDNKLEPFNLQYKSDVLNDATVRETAWPEFTFEQFHDVAFAKTVFIKFGFKNYEISPAIRQKWKLIWTYYRLKQLNENSDESQFPPLTQEELDFNNAIQKKADSVTKAAEQKKLADARALKVNQDAAAKGDLVGLLRMGERYRDGDGVEKDLAKAKDYLQRAAAAGSPTAADELKRLPQ